MVFILFGGGRTSRVVKESLGPCCKDGCDGRVNLIETTSKTTIWFVPVGNSTQEIIRCQTCGYSLKAAQYNLQMKYGIKSSPSVAKAEPIYAEKE
mmetsp:Transcript_19849/g.27225  ORF Transcript_19849/g.27225 Transcript_19849/m.27225 type:complete len:95 (-) Transcript_19849:437-721(-)